MVKKSFVALLLLLTPVVTFAYDFNQDLADLFNSSSTDLSLNYLGLLFGTVGNALVTQGDGPAGNIIAGLFNIFNTGIMVFAGGFISYTIFRSVINTAQDGGGAGGQGKGNAWPTIRIIMGVSLLMPMYNGYSMAQVTVMWSVVQGVGLANTMWGEAVNHLKETGGGMMSMSDPSAAKDLQTFAVNGSDVGKWSPAQAGGDASVADLMNSAACLAVVDANLKRVFEESSLTSGEVVINDILPAVRSGEDCQPVQYNQSSVRVAGSVPSDNTICFGVQTNPSMCGEYTWSFSTQNKEIDLENTSSNVRGLLQQGGSGFYSIMQNSYNDILVFLDDHADKGAKTDFSKLIGAKNAWENESNLIFTCDIPNNNDYSRLGSCFAGVSIASLASQYYSTTLSARLIPLTDEDSTIAREARIAWAKEAENSGWIMAGQSYHNFATTKNTNQSTLADINIYRFKTVKEPMQQLIDILDTSCIAANNNSILSLSFSNLGKSLANINGTANEQGSITIYPKSKYFVGACMLLHSVGDYASYANLKLQAIEAATLTSRLSGSDLKEGESSGIETALGQLDQITAVALDFIATQNVGSAAGPFMEKSTVWSTVKLNVAQDNIKSMLLNIFGKLLGIYPFDKNKDGKNLSATFSNGKDNLSGDSFDLALNTSCFDGAGLNSKLKDDCAIGNVKNCFQQAVDANCISKGQGILGSMASANLGQRVDQVMLLSNLGVEMINNAVFYWQETIAGTYKLIKRIAQNYVNAITAISVAGAVSAGSKAGGLSMGPIGVGVAIAGAVGEFAAQLSIDILQFEFRVVAANVGLYLPFGATLAGMFFTLGVTLGLYLPLIPFLTFLFGAIGWLIAVVEAMVAAPLVALGVTHPSGHDLLGKAEQAVILLLGIFVRPAAMIIGFILAIILAYVAMEMLNVGFLQMIINYLDQTSSSDLSVQGTTSMIGFCGVLIIYVYITISVINQAFSLIYQVPEKLLRWIGGAPEANTTAQMMGEIKGGSAQSAGQSSQGAQQTASQAPQVQPGQGAKADFGDWDGKDKPDPTKSD